jgi:hypothetical protein
MPRRRKDRANGTADPADIQVADVTAEVFPDGVPKNDDGSVATDATISVEEARKAGAVGPESAQYNRDVAKKIHAKQQGKTDIRWGESEAIHVFDLVKQAFPTSMIQVYVQRTEPDQQDFRPFPMSSCKSSMEFYDRIMTMMHKQNPAATYTVRFKEANGSERGRGYLRMPDTTAEIPPPKVAPEMPQQPPYPPLVGPWGYPQNHPAHANPYAQPMQPQYPYGGYPPPQAAPPPAAPPAPTPAPAPAPAPAAAPTPVQQAAPPQIVVQQPPPPPQPAYGEDPRMLGHIAATYEELKESRALIQQQQLALAQVMGELQEMKRQDALRQQQPPSAPAPVVAAPAPAPAPAPAAVPQPVIVQVPMMQPSQQPFAQTNQQPMHQPYAQQEAREPAAFGANVPMAAPAPVRRAPPPAHDPYALYGPQYAQQPYAPPPPPPPPPQSYPYAQPYPQQPYAQQPYPPQYAQPYPQQYALQSPYGQQLPPGAPQPVRQPYGVGAPPAAQQAAMPVAAPAMNDPMQAMQQTVGQTVGMITGMASAVAQIKKAVGANEQVEEEEEEDEFPPPQHMMPGGYAPPPVAQEPTQPFRTMSLGAGPDAPIYAYNEDGSPNITGMLLGNLPKAGPWLKNLVGGVTDVMRLRHEQQMQQMGVSAPPQHALPQHHAQVHQAPVTPQHHAHAQMQPSAQRPFIPPPHQMPVVEAPDSVPPPPNMPMPVQAQRVRSAPAPSFVPPIDAIRAAVGPQ